VLVTGASGFIGSQVIGQLVIAGETPRALVRSTRRNAPESGKAELVKGDLGSARRALDGIKTVIHLAYDIRASGTENAQNFRVFLDDMARKGVETLVHASSIVVHDGWPREALSEGSPITHPEDGSSYRGAKIVMERLVSEAVRRGDIRNAVILRPTLVYGPGGRMWTADIVGRLRRGTVLLPKRPARTADDAPFGTCHILHVEDLAAATLHSAAASFEGVRAYNLSDPHPPTWEEFYRAHARAIGSGTIEMVDFEELAARVPQPREAGGVPLAARVSSVLRRMVGNERVDTVMRRLTSYASAKGENIPDRALFELYASTGSVSSSKAETELGFRPRKTFEEYIEDMSAFLRST
jgi:nucleoside-diphosphate-sugar epimerase